MNLEQQIEKISSFEHLELLANQIVEGFISGMHKSPFMDFQQSLRNIKSTIQEKVPSISIGNYTPKPIDYTPNATKKKPICVVI